MADKSQGRGDIVDVVRRMVDNPETHDMVTGGVDTSQMPRSDNVVDQGLWNTPWISEGFTDVTGRVRGDVIKAGDAISGLFADDEPVVFPNIQAPGKIEQYRNPEAFDHNQIVVELREGKPTEQTRADMLNSIDPLGTIQRAGPESQPLGVDSLFDDMDSPAPVVRGAITVDPDAEAQKRALAKDVGLPVEAINEENIKDVENIRRENQISEAAKNAPTVLEMLGDTAFATVAHDSVESLAEIEKGLDEIKEKPRTWTETFGAAVSASVPSFKLSIAGALGASADNSEMGAAIVNQRPFGSFGMDKYTMQVKDEDVAKAQEAAKVMALDAFEQIQSLQPGKDDGLAKQYAFDLTMGLVNMVPTIATTMATGSPGMGSMIMSGQVYGSKYAESRYKDGRSEQEAREDAAFWAVAEGIPEYIPLAALLKGGKFVGSALLKEMGLEGVTEMFTQVLQEGYDVAVHGKDMTWGQFAKEVLYAGSVGAGMGGGMYMGTALFRPTSDDTRAANSKDNAERMTKVIEQAKQTGLAQRDPEAAIQHMVKAFGDRDMASMEISVPGMDAALGEEADAFYANLGLSPSQVDEARRLGSDVTVVSEMLLRHVAELNEEDTKRIMDHTRLDRDTMTAAEAEEYEREREELAKIEDSPTKDDEAIADEPEAKDAGAGKAPITDKDLSKLGFTDSELREGVSDQKRAEAEKGYMYSAGEWVPADEKVLERNSKFWTDEITNQHKQLEAFKKKHEAVPDTNPVPSMYGDGRPAPKAQQIAEQEKKIAEAQAQLDAGKEAHERWKAAQEESKPKSAGAMATPPVGSDFPGAPEPKAKSRWLPNRQPPADEAQAVAEEQLGMEALFTSAEEAGMSKEQYADYLVQVEKRKVASQNRTEIMRKKEDLRLLTAEWKARSTAVEAEVKQQLVQEPVYRAWNALATVRLDRAALVGIVGEENLANLPKHGKKAIWASGKEVGVDPDAFAELNGFADAGQMLNTLVRSTPFQEAVNMAVYSRMMRENGDLSTAHKEVRLALEGLQNDNAADLMALELGLLKLDKKAGRLTPAKVMAEARTRMKGQKVKQATPEKFFGGMRRAGKLAGKIVRSGQPKKKGEARKPYDRSAAYKAKFQQLLNFQMAREAYKVQAMVAKETKKLHKFARINGNKMRALPNAYREVMGGLFDMVRLDRDIGPHKGFDFNKWNAERVATGQRAVEFPISITANKGVRYVEDLTVGEFEDLVKAAKAIYEAGAEDNKLYNTTLAQGRDEAAMEIRELINKNIKPIEKKHRRDTKKLRKEIGRAFGLLMVNETATLARMDGKVMGRIYELIKRPIDRAMTHGYLPGRKGVIREKEAFGVKVNAMWDRTYTAKERMDMLYKEHQIPGVSKPITREVAIAVILNTGNRSNTEALLESSDWTEAEIEAVRKWVDKKDLDFAQEVWDLMDSFWPDIKATQERRHEPLGAKIEGEAFDTPHGRYRGGYYPLEYRSSESVDYDRTPVAELVAAGVRPGSHLRTTTQDGFTKQRQGSAEKKIHLNLGVFVRHGNRVIYDLEMGDAVADAWRIWNSQINQQTFKSIGRDDMYEHIKMFLENQITGELFLPDIVNRTARFAKAGLTASKLGFNVKTMLMQPLGLLNAMAVVSPRAQFRAVHAMFTSNPLELTRWINEDPGMQQRENTFNESMKLALDKMGDASWLKRALGGRDPKAFTEWSFFGIKKLQKLTDNLTYLMAFEDGMKKYDDEAKAREYAYRIVVMTQGSGNFNERTAFERGVTKRGMEQSDFIRAWNPMISFFAARYSMMVMQGQLAKGHPGKMAAFIAVWPTLFTVEAIVSETIERGLKALLDGTWDDEPEEDEEGTFWKEVGWRAITGPLAGIPLIRDVSSAAQGFATGGAVGSMTVAFARAGNSVMDLFTEGKVDKTLWNNVTNVLGFWGLPSAPSQSYLASLYRYMRGGVSEEDQSYIDMLMDVQEE